MLSPVLFQAVWSLGWGVVEQSPGQHPLGELAGSVRLAVTAVSSAPYLPQDPAGTKQGFLPVVASGPAKGEQCPRHQGCWVWHLHRVSRVYCPKPYTLSARLISVHVWQQRRWSQRLESCWGAHSMSVRMLGFQPLSCDSTVHTVSRTWFPFPPEWTCHFSTSHTFCCLHLD